MEATDLLKADHTIIKGALRGLRAMLERDDVDVATLRDMVTFSQTFVDRCHHGKEEECLFPCLQERGVLNEGGPIGVMLMEHKIGRKLVKQIDEAVTAYEADRVGREVVLTHVDDYVNLLEGHIFKEDNILFAMAPQVMGAKDDTETVTCYEETEEERVGHDVHEQMVGLARRIEHGGDEP